MRNIIIQTALSLYSNGGSSVTAALREAALAALKNGTITKPDSWQFDAEHFVYNTQSTTYLNSYSGPSIQFTQGQAAGAIYKSQSTTPAQLVYPYTWGYYDQLKITKIHLIAGGTAYATADVTDVTFDEDDDLSFTHTIWIQPYALNSAGWSGAFAIAAALRTGTCDKIVNLRYTTTTGGSTFYYADNFSWSGYVAHADTVSIASGNPNLMELINASGTPYASIVPYTAQSPQAGDSYDFEFTLGTT